MLATRSPAPPHAPPSWADHQLAASRRPSPLRAAATTATTTVCSPSSCHNVSTSLSSLPQLGGSSSNGSFLLLPGTYGHPLPPALQANTSTSTPLAGLEPFANHTLSSSASPFYLLPSLQGARLFEGAFWSGGQGESFAQGWKAVNVTVKAQSVIVSPESWLKLAVVGGGERVIWSSLAELHDGPLGIDAKKGFRVLDVQSGTSPPFPPVSAGLGIPLTLRVRCRYSRLCRAVCDWRLMRLQRRLWPERDVRLLARLLRPGLRAV